MRFYKLLLGSKSTTCFGA